MLAKNHFFYLRFFKFLKSLFHYTKKNVNLSVRFLLILMGMSQLKLHNEKTPSKPTVIQYSWCPWKSDFSFSPENEYQHIKCAQFLSFFSSLFASFFFAFDPIEEQKLTLLRREWKSGDFFCLIATFRVVTLPCSSFGYLIYFVQKLSFCMYHHHSIGCVLDCFESKNICIHTHSQCTPFRHDNLPECVLFFFIGIILF